MERRTVDMKFGREEGSKIKRKRGLITKEDGLSTKEEGCEYQGRGG